MVEGVWDTAFELILDGEWETTGGKPGRGEGERKGVLEVVVILLGEGSTLLLVEEKVGLM